MNAPTLARLASALSEDALQANVLELAGLRGWTRCHFRPARTSHGWRTALAGDPGFPDTVLAGHGRLVMAELKREGRYPDAAQARWLDALAGAAGVEVYVWRPSDWLAHRIHTVLAPAIRNPMSLPLGRWPAGAGGGRSSGGGDGHG